ncbi:AIPR family protein [Magnetospirillum moscoviense]|nr:AIPR family protein [Magnetospirillum moscoviense]
MENIEFIANVKKEMAELKEHGVHIEGDQFAIWFLTKILREPIDVSIERYHIGGAGDHKLDIGIIDDDHTAIVLGQVKYCATPLERVFSPDLPQEILNAKSRLLDFPEVGNERRKEFAKQYIAIEKERSERLFAIGFGQFSKEAIVFANKSKVEIYDFAKIKQRYIYNEVPGNQPEPDSIDITHPEFVIENDIASISARQWIFLANAAEIYYAVKDYQDSIFQQNLRYRLENSAKSGIGSEITKGILSTDTYDALSVFNNGITMVANKVTQNDGKFKVINPQIVNGCQTSWAIYDAYYQLDEAGEDISLRGTKVLIKLIEVSGSSLISKITETTNTQNAIKPRDLHANDDCQALISRYFSAMPRKIYYEYKAGDWEKIIRLNKQGAFRVKGKLYRKISNEDAAQLFLALIGRPYWAKQNKGKIFSDKDYYDMIFGVNLSDKERFDKPFVGGGITASTGADNFCKDVVFGYSLYALAEALKAIYLEKIETYGGKPASDEEMKAFVFLSENFKFMRIWHYLLIATIQYVVQKWKQRGKDESLIRSSLIGSDVDIFFGSPGPLASKFAKCEDKTLYLVLDEEKPSSDYATFAHWAVSIASKLAEEVAKSKSDPAYRFQAFIDQRAETFASLKEWIDGLRAGGAKQMSIYFPLPDDAPSS